MEKSPQSREPQGPFRIEDDLTETWIEDWAGQGVAEAEDFLAKRVGFLRFIARLENIPLEEVEL